MGFIFNEVIMETVDELMKIIDDSIDDEYWIAKNTKRCLLNQYWDLENVPGYVVEIYDRDNEKDHLFIADKPRSYLHKFTTELDSFHLPTCVWLTRWSDKKLEVDMEIGFFI